MRYKCLKCGRTRWVQRPRNTTQWEYKQFAPTMIRCHCPQKGIMVMAPNYKEGV